MASVVNKIFAMIVAGALAAICGMLFLVLQETCVRLVQKVINMFYARAIGAVVGAAITIPLLDLIHTYVDRETLPILVPYLCGYGASRQIQLRRRRF